MIIGNAKIFRKGVFIAGALSFEDGKITSIEAENIPSDLDAGGRYIVPGFVDIHTHGAMGGDASDGEGAALNDMSLHYARHGVTSFLGTTMTLSEETLIKAMTAMGSFKRPENGARLSGVHLEGPFLSYAKRGAQASENLCRPDIDMLRRLNDASGGMVKLITIAPEVDQGLSFIEEASKEVRISIGHTLADYDLAMSAFNAGATHCTHLFNAMPPLNHRNPGVVGAAMDSEATVELICDGIHIHDSIIRMCHRLFGHKLVIISDSMRCAGLPDGPSELGGQPVTVKDGKATLCDGTIAGSTANLLSELSVVVKAGIPLGDAIYSLTGVPAKAAGLFGEIGSLDKGKRADFLILNEDLSLHSVFLDGVKLEV